MGLLILVADFVYVLYHNPMVQSDSGYRDAVQLLSELLLGPQHLKHSEDLCSILTSLGTNQEVINTPMYLKKLKLT